MHHPYKVLEVVQSESNPDKTYEIRTSHQDGKTYCTCPGWIFKARKGDGRCKHIIAYERQSKVVLKVMGMDEYLQVRRARPTLTPNRKIDTEVDVKRRQI